MVSYCPEEKILFSNDAFGQHIGTSQRFDFEYPLDIILLEAKKYYANIVLPYSNQVKKALETVSKLDVEIIAPSHGIIWKNCLNDILQNYSHWSSDLFDNKAIIIYDTMWNSTEKMAYTIQESFEEKGYITSLYNLKMNHISDIMTDVLSAAYICVGSPTLNKQIMPAVASFLTYFLGLESKHRKGVAFGSHGWNNMSVKYIANYFKEAGLETIGSYTVKYRPSINNLKEIKDDLMGKI
jgi:flavorubredoxin